MPTPFLYLPLKVPVRHDLVRPLSEWLDDDESQVAFDNSHNNNYNNTKLSSPSGTDAPPPSSACWVLPKPTYRSVDCRSELLRLAALRNSLSESLQDSHRAALEANMLRDAMDYHATLLRFEQEGFPTSFLEDDLVLDSNNNQYPIALTWKGAFGTKQQEQHSSLLWDRVCTLWNVAALQSAEAVFVWEGNSHNQSQQQPSKEVIKVAISKFQSAANHLALCQQLVESLPSFTLSTIDLSKPMLLFWQKILLAQAQVAIYKLANHPDAPVKHHTTLAYLIQGAAPLYNEALTYTQDPRMKSEVPQPAQEWAAHCKAQSMLCQARAYFHSSLQCRIDKEVGTELARLKQTLLQLQDLLHFCDSTAVLKESVQLLVGSNNNKTKQDTISPLAAAAATIQPEALALQRLAQDRLQTAQEDNRTIYMEEVPSSLPEIRAQTMVKTNMPLGDDMMTPRVKLFQWT